jgi:hypothetical protein
LASFQIKRGLESALPSNKTDGCIYFCTDTGNIFIDYEDKDKNGTDVVLRKQINADDAATLSGESLANIMGDIKTKLSGKANKSELPTHLSDLINDSKFLTSYTESDPTVPTWAKASSKPEYTYEEVGADQAGSASKAKSEAIAAAAADATTKSDVALDSAKAYTDGKVSGLASTTVVNNKISSHNTSDSAHNDIRELITGLTTKLNNFLNVDDKTTDQLSEVLELIENNKGTLDSLTTSKINVSDIIDNLTTANAEKVLSANQGVAIKNLINALTEVVDGKADGSHSHDDRYYTEAEINTKVNTINANIDKKQDKLTFDSTPTSNSTKPVTSGGVYTALSSKADADSYLPLSGGTVTGNITFDNSTTSQKSEPYLQWAAYSNNKPYIGFAHDQTDGTFIICSMEKDTTTNGVKYYRNGLAIGGGSGNLFWKGEKVATATDLALKANLASLDLKANLASPTFTGTPKAPTASAGTNTTQIATTAFVTTAITNAIGNAIAASY